MGNAISGKSQLSAVQPDNPGYKVADADNVGYTVIFTKIIKFS